MNELAWAMLAVIFIVIPLFSYAIIRRYSDPSQSTKLTSSVAVTALSLSLITLFLVPIDIYTVSWNTDDQTGAQKDPQATDDASTAVKTFYYICYGGLVFLAFALMPFVYFYFEEEDEVPSTRAQFFSALKYTIAFILIFVVLLVLGIILRAGKFDNADNTPWVDKLKGSFDAGDSIMAFCVSCLATLGLFGWITYAAFGLASVPIGLMRGRVRPMDAKRRPSEEDFDLGLRKVQSEIKYLNARYEVGKREKTVEDIKELSRLRREERWGVLLWFCLVFLMSFFLLIRTILRRLQAAIKTRDQGSNQIVDRVTTVWNATAPLRIIVGVCLLGVSCLIVVSYLISTIDKIAHSECKTSCGYTLDKPQFLNPIDETLKVFSQAFPADYLAFGGIILYIFLCSISAIVSVGVRLLVWKLYDIQKKNTMPHGLIMGVWLLMFMVLLMNMEMLVLAPQYTTFGNQFYLEESIVNNATVWTKTPCTTTQFSQSVNGTATQCIMTQVAQFINKTQLALPFSGVIFYYANYLFITTFFIACIYSFMKTPKGPEYTPLRDDYQDI